MIPVVLSPLGIPVRPVSGNAPPMRISPNGLGIPIRISDLGAPFVVAGLVPPVMVEVNWTAGGSGFTWVSDGQPFIFTVPE